MNHEQTAEAIELNITEAKKIVAFGEKLERLSQNPDFVSVITEGYFKEEAHRLVMVKSTPAMQDEQKQADITKAIDAIGGLYQYFLTVQMKANMALDAISADEETLEEIASLGENLELDL